MARNCDADVEPAFYVDWDPGLRRCPNAWLDSEVWSWIRWWRDWKDLGSLPFGGSDVLAQPAYVAQVIRACEATHAEILHGRAEEQRRKLEAESRKARGNVGNMGRRR